MIKTVVTEAIISKGYEGADAIKIIQGEKGDIARVSYRHKGVRSESRWQQPLVQSFGQGI